MLTGIPTIDKCHHAIMQLAFRIAHCHEQEVADTFRMMLSTLEQTFDHEQRLMEEFQFPILQCHMEQHARVLASLHHLHLRVMDGDHASARRVAGKLLPEWFQLHMATQDAALGVWVAFCQQSNQASAIHKHESREARLVTQLPKHYVKNRAVPKPNIYIGPML